MDVVRIVFAIATINVSACSAASDLDPKVAEIAELTRRTTATYSLYTWNRITLDGEAPKGDWAAEFHRGSKHRVETSGNRLVADCVSMKGSHLDLASGKLEDADWVAKAACGINANKPIDTSQYVGPVNNRFGTAKRVRMTDPDSIRTYDVVDNGALVAATIADLDGTMRVDNLAVALLPTVPDGDIFSAESLRASVVPDQYKIAPAAKR